MVDDGGISTTNLGLYNMQSGDFDLINTTRVSDFASSPATAGYKDDGQDLGATINGIVATASGKTARINTDSLDVEVTLNTSLAQTLGAVGGSSGALTITGDLVVNGELVTNDLREVWFSAAGGATQNVTGTGRIRSRAN